MPYTRLTKHAFERYLPKGTVEDIERLMDGKYLKFKITKPRKTKLGDYRPPQRGIPYHQITVNGDLNRYAFLVTLVHELAHMETYEQYPKKQIQPHGKEWKTIFKKMLQPFIDKNIFPESIHQALNNYLENPAAATCTDYQLTQALRQYDKNRGDYVFLDELPTKSCFIWNNKRVFRKEQKLRTRFRCLELKTKKIYLFHKSAEVKPHPEN